MIIMNSVRPNIKFFNLWGVMASIIENCVSFNLPYYINEAVLKMVRHSDLKHCFYMAA